MKSSVVWHYLALLLIPVFAWAPIFFYLGLNPIGGDTYYHIKYATSIITTGKVITTNPYFPNDPLAYPLGSHIIVANLSILSGVEVSPIVAMMPLIFGILIVLVFFSLALRYLSKSYALLATLFFYGASIVPITETAVNGAPILNSLVWPFTSILVGVFLFYLVLVLMSLEPSKVRVVLTGVSLGGLVLSFHLLAMGGLLIMLAYGFVDRSYRTLKETGLTLIVAIAVSSFYLFHIVASGLPTETSAFGTYVQLSLPQYFVTLGPSITTLLIAGLLIVIFGRNARLIEDLHERKILLLLVYIAVFLVASQAWRVGLVLVNDLFLFFGIGPLAILGTLVLARFSSVLKASDTRILATVIASILLMTGPVAAYASIEHTPILTGSDAYFEAPYLDVIGWLNTHATGQVFASEIGAQYLIASEANVRPVAIPAVISDYYVPDLASRIRDLQNILGYSIPTAVATANRYNLTYIISARPQPYYSITGSNYVTPVFPAQPCFHGSDNSFDMDADGAPETFDTYLSNTTDYYLLVNSGRSPTITMNYFFGPNTSGPIQVYVNDTLLAALTGSVRDSWVTYRLTLPSSLIGNVENVKVENMDPTSTWYLQDIGIGNIRDCSSPTILFPRETIFLFVKDPLANAIYPQSIPTSHNQYRLETTSGLGDVASNTFGSSIKYGLFAISLARSLLSQSFVTWRMEYVSLFKSIWDEPISY